MTRFALISFFLLAGCFAEATLVVTGDTAESLYNVIPGKFRVSTHSDGALPHEPSSAFYVKVAGPDLRCTKGARNKTGYRCILAAKRRCKEIELQPDSAQVIFDALQEMESLTYFLSDRTSITCQLTGKDKETPRCFITLQATPKEKTESTTKNQL